MVHLEARLSCVSLRWNHGEEKNVRHLAIEAPFEVIKMTADSLRHAVNLKKILGPRLGHCHKYRNL